MTVKRFDYSNEENISQNNLRQRTSESEVVPTMEDSVVDEDHPTKPNNKEPITSRTSIGEKCDKLKFSSLPCSTIPSHSESSTIGNFEDILKKLGCFGPFQAFTLVLYLIWEIAAAFVVFIPIFEARVTDGAFKNCSEIANNANESSITNISPSTTKDLTVSTESNETVSSEFANDLGSFIKSLSAHGSIIEEWDLTCDKAWIPDMFTTCVMVGMMTGNLVTCQVADWYGRRKSYLLILVLAFIGTAMSALSPSIYFYAVARFISGIGFVGIMNISSMTVIEFMTPEWRSFANCVGPMGEGIMLLSLLAYFIPSWRMLYLATLVPYLLIFPIYAFLPESPRWLLRNKKMKEAHIVLGYMAKINKREPVSMEALETLRKQEEVESESQKAQRLTYLEFLRNRTLLVTSLYLFAIWFVWNLSYYGISYNIRNVPGNQYINVGLIGLANAIGQRSSMPVSDKIGRRKAVLGAMVLSAVFLVGLAICFLTIDVSHILIVIVCFVALLGMACARASARLLSGESFPTAVRTMGLGVGGLGANFAGLVTAQVAYIGSKWPAVPFFIFAIVAVSGSLVVFMMKETNGAPLTDEIKTTRKNKSLANANP